MGRREEKASGGFANYFTTLRDGATGTPKRETLEIGLCWHSKADMHRAGKYTSRKSLQSPEQPQKAQRPEKENDVEAQNDIREDSAQAAEKTTPANVRELLDSPGSPHDEIGGETKASTEGVSSIEEDVVVDASLELIVNEDAEDAENITSEDLAALKSRPEETASPLDGNKAFPPAGIEPQLQEMDFEHVEEIVEGAVITDAVDTGEETTATIPAAAPGSQTLKPTRTTRASPNPKSSTGNPQECESPQIGTTLLRRESLRSKASPRKRGSAQKKTPKRNGLKKRDTLQEREILQQFTENLEGANAEVSPSKNSPAQAIVAEECGQLAQEPSTSQKHKTTQSIVVDAQTGNVVLDQTILENKDLQRAVEAIEVRQNSKEEETIAALNDASPSVDANNNIDQANDFIAKSEVEQAAQTIAEVCEKADVPTLPPRKLRSGARFSDDTSMLKDFLNRAQAKKAAKDVPFLSADAPKLEASPGRRSPRKAHEPRNIDSLSPQKCKRITGRPTTPPRKPVADDVDSSDDQETANEPAAFRRSTRTRLPAPSKTPPGAPSFIPVRRGDGTDPVVLQKSQAQEVAIVTRANTRRNKGQSKPPALALQDLPANSPVKMTAKERADQAKKVGWAEKLASFQECKDAPEEPEDQKPKVRRMRGLGNVNGTPAAKKTAAVVPPSNGTPAPKRRNKTAR